MRRTWSVVCVLTITLAGCAVEQEYSRTPRTAVEQLLLTQAIERAFHNLHIELPSEATLEIQATSLDSDRTLVRMSGPDLASAKHPALETTYLRDAVSAVLGRQGYRIPIEGGTYLARVMVESLGTMQGLTFIGLRRYKARSFRLRFPNLRSTSFRSKAAMLDYMWICTTRGQEALSDLRPRLSDEPTMTSSRCCSMPHGPLLIYWFRLRADVSRKVGH
jgi:hypothetical protein